MNLDLIPSAEELHSLTIDVETAKRQEEGIEKISAQLRKTSELGFHVMTLYQNYMIKTYSLDIMMLKKVFEEKGYKVAVTKGVWMNEASIVIRW